METFLFEGYEVNRCLMYWHIITGYTDYPTYIGHKPCAYKYHLKKKGFYISFMMELEQSEKVTNECLKRVLNALETKITLSDLPF